MSIFRRNKQRRARVEQAMFENRGNVTTFTLQTPARGSRTLTVHLTLDQVEDLLRKADADHHATKGTYEI